MQTPIASFRDLVVWQKAMNLVVEIYALTREFPRSEEYRLVGQMTRAAVSIPANLAEGHARQTRRDYAHFVAIAKGSQAELETYLILVERLGFATPARMENASSLCGEVRRMLIALHQRLQDQGE